MNEVKAMDWDACVDQASALLGMSIADPHRPGVIAKPESLAQVAQAVNSLPLTEIDEAAPVYRP